MTASIEAYKTLARRFIEEVWNQGKLAVVDELMAENFVDHAPLPGQPPGREGYRWAVSMERAAFPDLHLTIDDLICEGDKSVVRYTMQATHQGPFFGIPPTGKRVTMTGIVIMRHVDGLPAEGWEEADTLSLMQQLGAIPTRAPAPA